MRGKSQTSSIGRCSVSKCWLLCQSLYLAKVSDRMIGGWFVFGIFLDKKYELEGTGL